MFLSLLYFCLSFFKFFFKMFLILFFCLLLIGGFVYIFPEFYISELVLSFLPYLLFAYFIIFVYSFSIRKKIVKLFMVFCSLFLLFLY